MQYYLKVLKDYVKFSGRARRSEYWFFVLFNALAGMVATFLDGIFGINFDPLPYGYIYVAYMLFTLLPGLAVTVRRLQDTGKSGWFIFIVLVPLAGIFWLLYVLAQDGEPAENKYGPNPKGEVTISPIVG